MRRSFGPSASAKLIEWLPTMLLPNVDLQHPIECRYLALVPAGDTRIIELRRAHPRLSNFLSKFKDAFGIEAHPSVMIMRRDAPTSVRSVEALASFRDSISMSVILRSRSLELLYQSGHRIQFANAFSIYPWMLDKNYEHLIANTPAMLAVHDVAEFSGQTSPEIPCMRLSKSDIDDTLLSVLCRRWEARYTKRTFSWKDRALFRSLNMANQASQLPAGSDTTLYDVGRLLALWVAAFEILVHPRDGKANLMTVYDVLESVEWTHLPLRHRRYKACRTQKTEKKRRNLACWLYGEIYKARNDFLHGNEVSSTRLRVKRNGRSLFGYAAPLYRMVLTERLPVKRKGDLPPLDCPEELGRYIGAQCTFLSHQVDAEKALLTARARKDSSASGRALASRSSVRD